MKRIASIAFLLIFCFSAMVQLFYVFHYFVNYEQYATELCENKSNVELHCNGKCQLNKEIKSTQQHNEQTPLETLPTHLSPFILNYAADQIALVYAFSDFSFHYNEANLTSGFYKESSPPPEILS